MPLPTLRLLTVAVALVTASSAALAIGSMADINVIDRNTGQVLPVYTHQGRHYVAGRPGARYAVRVYNRANARVMAVMSVDGINVVSGDAASWDQNGYVLSSWQRHDVAGWRKSQAQVAAFEFTALPNSYAARTGRPENVGVIGVALFRERAVPVQMPAPAPRPYGGVGGVGGVGGPGGPGGAGAAGRDGGPAAGDAAREEGANFPHGARTESAAADAAPAARKSLGGSGLGSSGAASSGAASSADNVAGGMAGSSAAGEARALSRPPAQPDTRLGTGHGARENAWVNYTEFERARATPDEIITIYYDSRDHLVAQGVIPAPRVTPVPQPFPVQPQIGFVPDPPRI